MNYLLGGLGLWFFFVLTFGGFFAKDESYRKGVQKTFFVIVAVVVLIMAITEKDPLSDPSTYTCEPATSPECNDPYENFIPEP